jgi:1-acyl-sn-glycerol-3-phosphate acyltransferase
MVGEPIPVPADADPAEVTAQYKAVMAEMLDRARTSYEPLTGPDLKFLPVSMGGTAPTLAEATRLDNAEAAERQRKADERRAEADKPKGDWP